MDRTERRALAGRIDEAARTARETSDAGSPAWQIWSDGSVIGGAGAWAAIVVPPPPGAIRRLRGTTASTSIRDAEATAILEGLQAVPDGAAVAVYSDSRPVLDNIAACCGLLEQRIADHARRLAGLRFDWVPAHAGAPLNVQADRLARRTADAASRRAARERAAATADQEP